jgi:hypothetical protein
LAGRGYDPALDIIRDNSSTTDNQASAISPFNNYGLAAFTALWAIMTWLQRFPEQINHALIYPLLPVAGTLALSIACLTVGSTTAMAARASPVESLRYE